MKELKNHGDKKEDKDLSYSSKKRFMNCSINILDTDILKNHI